jgi:hypothetical protein
MHFYHLSSLLILLQVASQLSSGMDFTPQRYLLASSLPPFPFSPSIEGGSVQGLRKVNPAAPPTRAGSATRLLPRPPQPAGQRPFTLAQLLTASWIFTGSAWRVAAGSERSSRHVVVLTSCPCPASYHHQLQQLHLSLLPIADMANRSVKGDKVGTEGRWKPS